MAVQFFAVGQEATGVIALGQSATGFIAIGQMATGVIAIGQLARGVVAIGMLSCGLVSVGMLSLGVFWSAGMLGAGGRAGGGAILPLVPVPASRARLPALADVAALARGATSGWARVRIEASPGGLYRAFSDAMPLPFVFGPATAEGAATAAREQHEVLAYVVPGSSGAEVLRLARIATAGARAPSPGVVMLQLAALLVAAFVWVRFAGVDLVTALVGVTRALLGS